MTSPRRPASQRRPCRGLSPARDGSASTPRSESSSAAEALGYRASGLPGLVGASTGTPALVTDITNPFYVEIIRGVHEAAADARYMVVLSHSREDSQLERAWTERGLSAMDGVLLASSPMSNPPFSKEEKVGLPPKPS